MQKPLLQASYEVTHQCIRVKTSHSAPENLIKPCTIRMVELVLGTEAAKKMKDVPLYNYVIGGRVEDMSCDILEIQTTTKAADVFRLLDEFFQKHQIKWEKVGSVCTDGAPAMLGNKSGFAALVKERVPDIITKHCVLHRRALAVKTLPSHFKEVLSVCVKGVNYIRGRALNHRVFKLFCEEMGSEHQVLLFHTEVRWLSRRKMLTCIAELADEIAIFLREYQSDFAEKFADDFFNLSLSYLADIFGHLNDLNLSLQGMFSNNIDCTVKVEAFKKKISLWKRRIQGGNVGSVPILDEKHGEKTIQPMLAENIVAHFSLLETTMAQYFPMDHSFPEWIQHTS
ncbi:protein FAM200C-like [Palaemon carinicauda]|uniref:protein FAM200C-like n=1 Tax=Palaemon carinicauda TaxID=392227 RepID=UPI0035B683AF